MKTTFRPRSSINEVQRKRLTLVLIVLAISILVFVFLRSYIILAVSPLWRAENTFSTSLRNAIDLLKSKEVLVKENEALKEQLSSYNTLLTSFRTLEGSQDELLSHFGRAKILSIAAGVLAHPPETPYDVLVIDAGAAEGVKQEDKVSLPEGGALGVVREVFAHESKVELYSTSGERTSVVLERGKIPATLLGQSGGTFSIELPRAVPVEVGDKILLPGLRAELVGVVAEVALEPTDSAKHILVKGVGNVTSIRFVTVH